MSALLSPPLGDYEVLLRQVIYEMIEERPIFYKNFAQVLIGKKKPEDIMGSSGLQAAIIAAIIDYLYENMDRKKYKYYTGEVGFNLKKGTNLACDLVIFDKDKVAEIKFDDKYLKIPPKIVIEVDTKADVGSFVQPEDYYRIKTEKLLDFGVEKIIWYFTADRKVTVATAEEIKSLNWEEEINILKNLNLSLGELLEKEGIWF